MPSDGSRSVSYLSYFLQNKTKMTIYNSLPLCRTRIPVMVYPWSKKRIVTEAEDEMAHMDRGGAYGCGYVYPPYTPCNLEPARMADNWYWPIIGRLRYTWTYAGASACTCLRHPSCIYSPLSYHSKTRPYC